MNKKTAGIVIAAIVVIVLLGVAIFVIRNISEKPPVTVTQQSRSSLTEEPQNTPEQTTYTAVLQGVDTIHWGRGTAKITTDKNTPTLSFSEDFEVAQGPDLFVYLSPNPAGQELGEYASLGALNSIKGAQEYTLPSNYKDYKTVVIWCRAFSVTFATADLDFS